MTTKSLTHRELAWALLKETRNPEYVALRYGYPIEKMREALGRIPYEKPLHQRLTELHDKATGRHEQSASEADVLASTERSERVPGEDDEI